MNSVIIYEFQRSWVREQRLVAAAKLLLDMIVERDKPLCI